jgi:hypothetical protein
LTCEEKEIEVCRDGKIAVIKVSDRKETDTNLPCPTYVKVCRGDDVIIVKEDEVLPTDTQLPCAGKIEVCRDGKLQVILETEKLPTDTTAPCPVTLAATTLPNTGPGSIAAIFSGLAVIGGSAHAVVTRKRL